LDFRFSGRRRLFGTGSVACLADIQSLNKG
jgi:hypothetical protein